jgi:hypothetical protein
MSAPRSRSIAMVLACALAAVLALFVRPSASAGTEPVVHGVAPMAGALPVPAAWLPPGAPDPDDGPSDAIYPAQRVPLRFDHAVHVTKLGQPCASCHEAATTSRASSDRLLPAPERCDGCHGTDHADRLAVRAGAAPLGACATCHRGWSPADGNRVARVELPAPNLRFDHAAHAARNIGCAQCHGAVERLELATRQQLPRMQGCFACHAMDGAAAGDARGDCLTCHVSLPDGRMRTAFASGELRPPRWMKDAAHDADFLERHRRLAVDEPAFCATCHTEDSCADCHDGRVRPRSFHPNDYLSMHPIAARQDVPRCASCHQDQGFCLPCHQRLGVTESGPNVVGRRFHPDGFAARTRGPGHHAWEAERNLAACTSCHTERDCASCHASTGRQGRGLSPHPAGGPPRCADLLRRNPRPCLVCHEPGSAELVAPRCR